MSINLGRPVEFMDAEIDYLNECELRGFDPVRYMKEDVAALEEEERNGVKIVGSRQAEIFEILRELTAQFREEGRLKHLFQEMERVNLSERELRPTVQGLKGTLEISIKHLQELQAQNRRYIQKLQEAQARVSSQRQEVNPQVSSFIQDAGERGSRVAAGWNPK